MASTCQQTTNYKLKNKWPQHANKQQTINLKTNGLNMPTKINTMNLNKIQPTKINTNQTKCIKQTK